MIRQLYVIYDRVAEESGPIFEAKNDGIANRRYKALIAEQTHQWFEESDYILLHIGSIDKSTNEMETITPEVVDVKLSLIDMEKEDNAESL